MEASDKMLEGFSFKHDGSTIFVPVREGRYLQGESHYVVRTPVCVSEVIGSTDEGSVLSRCQLTYHNFCIWSTTDRRNLIKIKMPEMAQGIIVKRQGSDFLVFISETADDKGAHILDLYHPSTDRWIKKCLYLASNTRVIPNSAVACSDGVYWKIQIPGTEGHSNRILFSDLNNDDYKILRKPRGQGEWQIGSSAGKFCCVLVTASEIICSTWNWSQTKWDPIGSLTLEISERPQQLQDNVIRCAQAPHPLKFKNRGYQFVLLMDGSLLIMECSDPNQRRVTGKILPYAGPVPQRLEDFVPHTVLLPRQFEFF